MKTRIKIFLVLLFLSINIAIYFLTQKNSNDIVKYELDKSMHTLQTHYNILLASQKSISYAIYKSILRNTDVTALLEKSYNQTSELQAKNRNILSAKITFAFLLKSQVISLINKLSS